jgi:hypothetical protein
MEQASTANVLFTGAGPASGGSAGGARPRRVFAVLWALGALALLTLGYRRFFGGTYFTQDDFVWMCFCKYYPGPLRLFWQDSLAQQFFRPVGLLWYLGVFALAGNEVVPYQVGFLLVHLLNSCLAARLAGRLIDPSLGRCVGLVFALNALFVTGISPHYFYIFDTLGCFFFLVSLIFLSLAQDKRSVLYGTASLVAALASYLTKEAYFTLPAAAALVLGVTPGAGWDWSALRRRWRWLVPHALVWGLSLGWRTWVIGGLGGYGLASVTSMGELVDHLAERAGTWLGFAGWSLLPALARPAPEDRRVLLASAAVLAVLTAAAWVSRANRPWVVWSWCWMAVTWAPSLTMTTYAPVSWYTPAFGAVVLGLLAFHRRYLVLPAGLLLGLYLGTHASSFYLAREPVIAELRSQQQGLERQFPAGGWSEPGHAYRPLFGISADLYPDPVVKFHTPDGAPMADVFFLNPKDRMMWVLTNDSRPEDLWPLVVSAVYQRGFVDIGRYRAYPLERTNAQAENNPPPGTRRFAPLQWYQGRFIEVAFRPQGR